MNTLLQICNARSIQILASPWVWENLVYSLDLKTGKFVSKLIYMQLQLVNLSKYMVFSDRSLVTKIISNLRRFFHCFCSYPLLG